MKLPDIAKMQRGIVENPFEEKIVNFDRVSKNKIAQLIELLSYDHQYHKNFLYRILAAKYLDSQSLKQTYEFFLRLCQGKNGYSL